MPPEIRIGDRLSGKGKNQEHKDQSEQPATGAEPVDKSSLCRGRYLNNWFVYLNRGWNLDSHWLLHIKALLQVG